MFNRWLLGIAISRLPKKYRENFSEEWKYELSEITKSNEGNSTKTAKLYVQDVLASTQIYRKDEKLTPSYLVDVFLGFIVLLFSTTFKNRATRNAVVVIVIVDVVSLYRSLHTEWRTVF